MQQQYLTVTALNNYIKYRFDNDVFLQTVYLEGEISNFKAHSSGHLYFALKDDYTQISCVMFQTAAKTINFRPKNGSKVRIRGKVSTYPVSGTYQIYVSKMEDAGLGDLFIAFEKLKQELNKLGYFKEEYKKPLPKFPKVIGVITSPTGAVIRDIIKTINRRYHNLKIIVYPTKVQGEGAKESIAYNINKANIDNLCDVLILARGGGSLEDLWPFNERMVADAIFNSKIPLVSAVGHETDFTISDYVADIRAATPTLAGVVVTPDIISLKSDLINKFKVLNNTYNSKITILNMKIMELESKLKLKEPNLILRKERNNLDSLFKRLELLYKLRFTEKTNLLRNIDLNFKKINLVDNIKNEKHKLFNLYKELNNKFKLNYNDKYQQYILLNTKLESLNPTKVMKKGFSLASIDNKYIRSIKEVQTNDIIETKVIDGTIKSKVLEVKKDA